FAAHAAVSVLPVGSKGPDFGVIEITAKTYVSRVAPGRSFQSGSEQPPAAAVTPDPWPKIVKQMGATYTLRISVGVVATMTSGSAVLSESFLSAGPFIRSTMCCVASSCAILLAAAGTCVASAHGPDRAVAVTKPPKR